LAAVGCSRADDGVKSKKNSSFLEKALVPSQNAADGASRTSFMLNLDLVPIKTIHSSAALKLIQK
jgi:hypothetical protein